MPLHPALVEHLRQLVYASIGHPAVFPWAHDDTTLRRHFWRIQQKAGIRLICEENHEHTLACHCYGFHDLRRAFASMNAIRLGAEGIRALMRHRSYQTTRKYLNMTTQLDGMVGGFSSPMC